MGYLSYRAEKAAVNGGAKLFIFLAALAVILMFFVWPVMVFAPRQTIGPGSHWTTSHIVYAILAEVAWLIALLAFAISRSSASVQQTRAVSSRPKPVNVTTPSAADTPLVTFWTFADDDVPGGPETLVAESGGAGTTLGVYPNHESALEAMEMAQRIAGNQKFDTLDDALKAIQAALRLKAAQSSIRRGSPAQPQQGSSPCSA